jgi:hypothetical protein
VVVVVAVAVVVVVVAVVVVAVVAVADEMGSGASQALHCRRSTRRELTMNTATMNEPTQEFK